MSSQIWWFLARGSGIVAWLMLTASVLWGILLSTTAFKRWRRPAWILDLHRWLAALTIGFVALHIASLVADTYTHFGAADILVPWASAWRPTAVAFGIIATWILATVEITSLAKRHLPKRTWHAIHLGSYAVFALGTVHGILAGTDRVQFLFQATGAIVLAATAVAIAYRVLSRPRPGTGPRVPQSRRDPGRVPQQARGVAEHVHSGGRFSWADDTNAIPPVVRRRR